MDAYQGKRLQSKRLQGAVPTRKYSFKRFLREWGDVILLLLAIFVLGKVVFQIAWVPSSSMETTIPTNSLQICWRLPYFFGDPAPRRGDVITFWSEESHEVMVKRVIGLPGETVSFRDGYVYIDGVPLEEDYLSAQGVTAAGQAFTVPEDCVFFMGDNRTGSFDARFWDTPFISFKELQAKVLLTISIGKNHSWQGVRLIAG